MNLHRQCAKAYPATVLADICESVLAARSAGTLPKRLASLASQCEVLIRGFARVGIIALVDEVTGYQKERARDSLAKILASVTTAMKLSDNYPDFINKLNRVHPRYGETYTLDLEQPDR